MKIFLSFLQSDQQHAIPAYSFWQRYIKNGITEAGHTWVEHPDIDWALGIVPKSKAEHDIWKQEAWEKAVIWLKENPADLFLSYLYPGQIDRDAIKQIQNSGIPCVNFFCDNVREFKKAPIEFSEFDLNWVPEFKAVKLYQKAGYPYLNLPMPIWVDPGLRVLQEESNDQITFIGSKDIQRLLFFEKIIIKSPELDFAVYGAGWDESALLDTSLLTRHTFNKKLLYQFEFFKKNGNIPYLRKLMQRQISPTVSQALKSRVHGTISFEDYNKLTAESMITMGINRYPSYNFPIDRPNTYSRLRDIEAPMLGACYLTEQTEGIENLYDIGNEIEIYKDPEGFIEKAKELQIDSKKRKLLKINGQKRALRDHSIGQSLNKIFQKLN